MVTISGNNNDCLDRNDDYNNIVRSGIWKPTTTLLPIAHVFEPLHEKSWLFFL